MVSVYSYLGATPVAVLELYAIIDYGALDDPSTFTDAAVESNVSQAERYINIYTHQIFTGTIPDGVVACTLELSKRLMDERRIKAGLFDRDNPPEMKPTIIKNDAGLMDMLDQYIKTDVEEEDSICVIPTYRGQFHQW